MGRRKTKEEEALKHLIETRVNDKKYEELRSILSRTENMDMSTLVRQILYNRRIRTYTYDRTLDLTMEELSGLRKDLKAIGVNINQMTRMFNTYSEERKKEFYAKIAFDRYISLESRIDQMLEIITKLSNRWLSE